MAYAHKFCVQMAYDLMIMNEVKIVMNVNEKMNTYKISGLENTRVNSLYILITPSVAMLNH